MSQRVSTAAVPHASAPHQLQYLEAMGITAWTARYRMPNAAHTPECEWPEVAPAPATQPPAQRLHALLDESPAPTVFSNPVTPPAAPKPSASPGRMQALLDAAAVEKNASSNTGLSTPVQSPEPIALSTPTAPSSTVSAAPQALRFTLQVAALADRWLVVLVQAKPPTPAERRLLSALWAAAGIHSDVGAFIDFQWPMIEGLSVESPVIEAQQGINAFLDGRARAGLNVQQLVLFGADQHDDTAALRQVLDTNDAGQSELLSLPVWQGPALSELMASAELKAALWPALYTLGQSWQKATAAVESADA